MCSIFCRFGCTRSDADYDMIAVWQNANPIFVSLVLVTLILM
jgi:hypothetical protein